MFKHDDDGNGDMKLKGKLNEDSEKELKQLDSNRSEQNQKGIDEIAD